MNLFLFAFLFLSQAFDVVPIIGKLSVAAPRRDGVGEDARFNGIGAMWNVGPDLYIADGAIRKLNLQTREVSTVTLRASTGLRAVGHPSNSYSGLADLWSDGTYLYATDIGAGAIRRILLRTGEVEDFASAGSVPWGLTVEGNNLFVANARTREIPTSVAFRLNPAETSEWKTIGLGPNSIGYGLIESGAEGTLGVAIYTSRQNGAIISETSVPMSPLIREGRIYASAQGPINTGLAIANPGDTTATISFYFTDANGSDFGAGAFTIPPHQQIAKFLNDAPFTESTAGVLFGGARSIQGTFTFKSSAAVGAVALRGLTNERSEFLMTTLPIAPLSAGASSPTILPQYAAGSGWTTEVILVNPTDVPISGTLDFQSSIAYRIPPRTSRVFTSADGSSITTGAVTVTPSAGGAPTTVGIFSLKNNGVTVTSAGVPEVKPSKAFEVFDESAGNFRGAQAGSMGTGIAIANPSASAMTIHVEQYALDGVSNGRFGILTIPARSHVAVFTHEIPHGSLNPETWIGGGGRLRLWTDSDSGFSVVGLRARYNERGDFLITSTPALADDASPTSGPAIFPHFIQGAGYTTEFIFLNRTIGAIANGSVRYFSQSGQPVSIPMQ